MPCSAYKLEARLAGKPLFRDRQQLVGDERNPFSFASLVFHGLYFIFFIFLSITIFFIIIFYINY